MISRSRFPKLLLVVFAFNAGSLLAAEASLSLGQYEPSDGVVSDLYKNQGPAVLLRLGLPREDGLAWSSTLFYNAFGSRVANLGNRVLLLAISSGFRKSFLERDPTRPFGFEPFFGAGIGLASMQVKADEAISDKSSRKKSLYGSASSWEVGILLTHTGMPLLDFEMKMTDLWINRQLFETIRIGGRIFSLGVQYRLGD